MAEHINSRLGLLQYHISQECFIFAVSGIFHFHEYDFIINPSESFYFYFCGSAGLAPDDFIICRYQFNILPARKFSQPIFPCSGQPW